MYGTAKSNALAFSSRVKTCDLWPEGDGPIFRLISLCVYPKKGWRDAIGQKKSVSHSLAVSWDTTKWRRREDLVSDPVKIVEHGRNLSSTSGRAELLAQYFLKTWTLCLDYWSAEFVHNDTHFRSTDKNHTPKGACVWSSSKTSLV